VVRGKILIQKILIGGKLIMKKLIVITMLVVMVFRVMGCKNPASSSTNRTPADGSGSGTEAAPFIVGSAASLEKIGTGDWTLSAHYRQTVNITLSGEWTPIGNMADAFQGVYDGAGFSINNLSVSADTHFQGFFGFIGKDGVVRNVALRNVNIIAAGNSVGSISGFNDGIIKNCYVSGLVSGEMFVGGISGGNGGIIENSYTTCDVTGSVECIGGITGINTGTIQNCYVTGNISGFSNAGGIVGENEGTIKNSVALNSEVTITVAFNAIGRVAVDPGTLTNNFARAGMVLKRDGTTIDVLTPTPASDNIHGADVVPADFNGANSRTWWTSATPAGPGFNAANWTFANNRLPHLRTTTGAVFREAQNPAVQSP